jgi:hypothetical protein
MKTSVTTLADHHNADVIAAALLTAGPVGGWTMSTMSTANDGAVEDTSGFDTRRDTQRSLAGAFRRWTKASAVVLVAGLAVMIVALSASRGQAVAPSTVERTFGAFEIPLDRRGVFSTYEIVF